MTSSKFPRPPILTPEEKAARLSSPEAAEFAAGTAFPHASDAVRQELNPTPTPTPTPTTARKKNVKPWVGLSSKHSKQKPFRMPENEAAMLDYVAGTTFGETVQSVTLAGVRAIVVKLLNEQGIRAHIDKQNGSIVVEE
ncbi:hypothetical protein [Azonexus hydrophilus]|uniref:Uncharacterized protein n=1 Tax=Azonexus hydrophilus TaxID=418702 RepID=A0ABZ2XLM1_9RHOO